ncbi:MAG TPA: hypothetical protein VKV96_18485, partial [Roseiarcus sp.]|nr:hypothetical protein [Roseiarcus sp.]
GIRGAHASASLKLAGDGVNQDELTCIRGARASAPLKLEDPDHFANADAAAPDAYAPRLAEAARIAKLAKAFRISDISAGYYRYGRP